MLLIVGAWKTLKRVMRNVLPMGFERGAMGRARGREKTAKFVAGCG
jgi:hypothetical protein